MISKLDEINRILQSYLSLENGGQPIDVALLLDECRRQVIEGRMPNHEDSLEFATLLGYMESVDEDVLITDDGRAFVELNPENFYELSSEQKRLLIRRHYLDGQFRRQCRQLLKSFAPSVTKKTYRWSEVDSPPIEVESWLVEHLCQLGALLRGDGHIEVSHQFVETFAVFIEEGEGLTEEKLKQYLKEKLEVGEIGEKLMLQLEQERLRSAGHLVEARCVRIISGVRVNAGFDIESFDGASPDLVYDRLIEVKGAKGRDLRFFWSENEQKVAQRLGKQYWIYFQGGINSTNRTAKMEPLFFQDPVISVMSNVELTKTPQGLMVEGKMRGAPK